MGFDCRLRRKGQTVFESTGCCQDCRSVSVSSEDFSIEDGCKSSKAFIRCFNKNWLEVFK